MIGTSKFDLMNLLNLIDHSKEDRDLFLKNLEKIIKNLARIQITTGTIIIIIIFFCVK